MKNMLKTARSCVLKIGVLWLFVCCAGTAAAFDFGLLIENSSSAEKTGGGSFHLNQKDDVSAWIKIPLGKGVSHYLAAECLYRFEYDDAPPEISHYVDFPLLKYSFGTRLGERFLNIHAGRFFTADLTSRIFAQNADGCFVSLEDEYVSVQAYASYTGLLNGNTVKMTHAEDFDSVDSKKAYSFADKYLNAMITATFPNLFLQQSVAVQGIGSFRLAEKSYNRLYGTVSMSGPIYRSLMYDICASAAYTSYDGENGTLSPFIKGCVSYYFSKSTVHLSAVFAGTDFTGITSLKAYNSAVEPEYTDFAKAGISASAKPADCVLLSASFDSVFDGTEHYEFKGCQYAVGADIQAASDVLIGAGWVQYIDMNRTEENYMAVSLNAKIAL